MRSHAKASSAFTFGRKGFAVPALVALALAALFALALASSAHAADRHVDSVKTMTGYAIDVAIYEGTDSNPATDKIFLADVTSGGRIQRFGIDGSFERMWGKDVRNNGAGSTTAEICTIASECKLGEVGSLQGEFNRSGGIAIDQSDGSLYVWDRENRRVQKFDLDGNFERMWGWDVVSSGPNNDVTAPINQLEVCVNGVDVCKIGVAGAGTGQLGAITNAITESSSVLPRLTVSPTTGNVFVADGANRRIQEFTSSGAFIRAFGFNVVPPGGVGDVAANEKQTVSITATGGSFTLSWNGGTGTQTTAPIAFNAPANGAGSVQEALEGLANLEPGDVSVTGSAGGPWTVEFTGTRANADVNQMTGTGTALTGGSTTVTITTTAPGAAAFEICTETCQAGLAGELPGQFSGGNSNPLHVAVGPNGVLYAADTGVNNRVQRFDTTQATPAAMLLAPILSTANGGPLRIGATEGLEVDPATNQVYVLRGTSGTLLPQVQELNAAGTAVLSSSPPPSDVGQLGAANQTRNTVRGLGLQSSTGSLYASVFGNGDVLPTFENAGSATGYFVLDADGVNPVGVEIGAAFEVTTNSATVQAELTPRGNATYQFEYSKDGVAWSPAGPSQQVSGGPQTVSQTITGLAPNTLYRVRVTTKKIYGAALAAQLSATSAEGTFITDSLPPSATTFSTSKYSTTTATIGGRVNPNGSPTTYRFEWGKSVVYGNKVPVPDASAGAGTTDKDIVAELSGLQPDTVYHYRIVAESPLGEAKGADKTFRTLAGFGPPAPARGYEMVTPPFKALPQFGGPGSFFNNPNPGIPSLDGEAMMWANGHFPLSDEVDSPNSGDSRLMRRTASGWTFETRNTLPLKEQCGAPCAPGESLAPVFARVYAAASSGDMEAIAYFIGSGLFPEFLPSEGPIPNRLYTRRDGTGVEGWTGWLTNPKLQVSPPGTNNSNYVGPNDGDQVRFNDDGSAMARWYYYRGLAEDPETPLDDDPSDEQQLSDPTLPSGETLNTPGGRTIYLQRADDPFEMPTAPKDLVNECTGTGSGDATALPARIGSGAATDTIGTQSCWSSPGEPEATGTATIAAGSNAITALDTDTGSFAVGQIVKGPGIPPHTQVTAVNSGAGTMTLSAANTSPPPASGSGQVANGSNVITSVTTSAGEFKVGQKVRVSPKGFFIPPPPFDANITAVGAGTVTIDVTPAGLFPSPDTATLLVSEIPGAELEADSVHVTSMRGAALGAGGKDSTGTTFSQTAMSEDGSRVFFMSPDNTLGVSLPETGCTTASGPQSVCVPQLFVRQYDEEGNPTVRWISRAQGVGAQQIAELGRGAFFEGASRSGDAVYFKTNSPLLPNDPNGGNSITTGTASDKSFDLYRYELPENPGEDPANGTLTRVSGGPTGTADPSTNNSTHINSDAPVGGGGALRYLSDDGELAYFVTTSPLTGADTTPAQGVSTTPGGAVGSGAATSGIRNLYLFDDTGSSPQWRYVASLPFSTDIKASAGAAALNSCASFQLPVGNLGVFTPLSGAGGGQGVDAMRPEEGNCFRGTADGKHVLFQTAGRLTGDDTDNASDVYLYDYERDELTRVTAPPPGAAAYRCNVDGGFVDGFCNGDIGTALAGSTVILGTGGKSAGRLSNARGWGGGRYYNLASNPDGTVSVFFQSKSNLVPEDTDSLARHDVYEWREGKLTLMTPDFPEQPYWYSGSSLDGEDLFINTPARLDPREIDDNDIDIYDLRVGGGFPYTPPPVPCDVLAHQCRSTAAPNPEPRSSASAGFSGEGNLAQKAKGKPRCGKGKVRVKGRCVSKKSRAKKSKKASRRAANESGRAGR